MILTKANIDGFVPRWRKHANNEALYRLLNGRPEIGLLEVLCNEDINPATRVHAATIPHTVETDVAGLWLRLAADRSVSRNVADCGLMDAMGWARRWLNPGSEGGDSAARMKAAEEAAQRVESRRRAVRRETYRVVCPCDTELHHEAIVAAIRSAAWSEMWFLMSDALPRAVATYTLHYAAKAEARAQAMSEFGALRSAEDARFNAAIGAVETARTEEYKRQIDDLLMLLLSNPQREA